MDQGRGEPTRHTSLAGPDNRNYAIILDGLDANMSTRLIWYPRKALKTKKYKNESIKQRILSYINCKDTPWDVSLEYRLVIYLSVTC